MPGHMLYFDHTTILIVMYTARIVVFVALHSNAMGATVNDVSSRSSAVLTSAHLSSDGVSSTSAVTASNHRVTVKSSDTKDSGICSESNAVNDIPSTTFRPMANWYALHTILYRYIRYERLRCVGARQHMIMCLMTPIGMSSFLFLKHVFDNI